MTADEALLRSVIDRPDDDAPRLAYADHLDARGDADRAAFIRVQCALESIPPEAPERADLQAREQELLGRFAWDWAAEFGTRISQWFFRRGFIERVEMGLETATDEIVAILARAPIRHIRDVSQFCDLQGVVDALPHLERLTGLEFWGLYAFEDTLVDQMLASPHLRNLRTLILHHDRNGNMVETDVLVEGLAQPHRASLEELAVNVDGCWRGPGNRVLEAMARSPYLRRLRKLNLSSAGDEGNHPMMDAKTARLLGQSPNFAALDELDLGGASFPIEAWDEVLRWPWLSHLKWLRLHGARQVSPPSFMTVADLENLPEFRRGFEERVARVDWQTEFISPWDEGTCWKGFSWGDRPRRLLFDMQSFIAKKDYSGLEDTYRRLCEDLAGDERTREIDVLPFDRYGQELGESFERAIAALGTEPGRCLYLRLWPRPDLGWRGEFHIQAKDPEIREPCEEFSYESPVAEIPAPRFPEAGAINARQPLFSGTEPSGTALYLLARTIATLGRCPGVASCPVPLYFSCMYAVFRM